MRPVATFGATVSPHPEALICSCFDPRFKHPIDQLINSLGLSKGAFILKSLGGGPLTLAHPNETPSRCKGLGKQIRFTFNKFPSLRQLILIMHAGCAYYSQIPDQCHGDGKERRDLARAGSLMKGLLGEKITITLYYADLIDGGRTVIFYEIPTPHEAMEVPEFLKTPQVA